jgi:hypothetical protein
MIPHTGLSLHITRLDQTILWKKKTPWSISHPLKLTCLSEDLFTSDHCKRKNAATSKTMMQLETKSKRNQLNLLSQRGLQKHTSIHFTRSGTGSFCASASLMSFSTRFIWNIHHKYSSHLGLIHLCCKKRLLHLCIKKFFTTKDCKPLSPNRETQ